MTMSFDSPTLDRPFVEPGASLEASLPEGMTPDEFVELKSRLHERLVKELEPSGLSGLATDEIERRVRPLIGKAMEEESLHLSPRHRQRIADEILDEVTGYGPIQPLLEDPTINEVMVNGPRQVYVERFGKIELTDRLFLDHQHVMRIIDRIVAPLGRRIDESSPMVDARLPDGSRVNAIIPPLAIKGPTVTIRKFAKVPYRVEDLVNFGTLTEGMAEFLRACVQARLNI